MSYKELKSYQQASVIYDFTVEFCDKYIDWTYKPNMSNRTYTRTHDQMVQAARSGKQNIVEGSSNRTSEKSELKLLGVARASLQELLEDYEDFCASADCVFGIEIQKMREKFGILHIGPISPIRLISPICPNRNPLLTPPFA